MTELPSAWDQVAGKTASGRQKIALKTDGESMVIPVAACAVTLNTHIEDELPPWAKVPECDPDTVTMIIDTPEGQTYYTQAKTLVSSITGLLAKETPIETEGAWLHFEPAIQLRIERNPKSGYYNVRPVA